MEAQLSKSTLICLLLFSANLSFAHTEQLDANELNKLYSTGLDAYEKQDFSACLENLAVLEAVGSRYLSEHKRIAQGVSERLKICRDEIKEALHNYHFEGEGW